MAQVEFEVNQSLEPDGSAEPYHSSRACSRRFSKALGS